ncbi:MAG TPA: YbaK/EbsC family protein [Paraburkholderia sp.]|jgi:prolyl-tRNA editing enzyme YbaK/EbsC (Cys-tRNA(Pro) deacylase)|uniref:YbaK/EbsC family protein n=1 Tax=Paraburkholderia sp. TaxID=1926495 RepID=UPI002DECB236|nr:YbaK/EbsC family protein [Paraburkholderia sp.]
MEAPHHLDIVPEAQREHHVPRNVMARLPSQGVAVFTVDDDASDTAQFSERYGFGLEDCANTLVLRYKRNGAEHHAAVVTLGSRRLDVNGAVKARLGAQRLSFAKREQAVELTGMEFGGITAFGVPDDWIVLVDAAVMMRERIVMGAGVRATKLLLAPAILEQLPNVDIAPLVFDDDSIDKVS